MNEIKVEVMPYSEMASFDFDGKIYELDKQIDMMSPHADGWDVLLAISSGIACAMLDVLWVGEFDLTRGRNIASNQVEDFVKSVANKLGCNETDLNKCVKFLEDKFPLAADGNTSDFGGGLQHHFRDFAHHPTVVGLIFSLLTQFTEMSYGTDTNGMFKVCPVPESHKKYIGKDIPDKILKGTIYWFFHLVSDMAGSSSTASISGGTGIPGPILSLAKELSTLPFFKNLKVGDNELPVFLSKLFNGTLLAKHDENGKIIKGTELKLDLRGELGAFVEIGRQALPVIANECIVRGFYFVRRLAEEFKRVDAKSFDDFKYIDVDYIKPYGSPTLDRMLTISTAVFTTIDVGTAIITQEYFVAINYVGVGRFALAIGKETVNYLKVRDVKKIRDVYITLKLNTFTDDDNNEYKKVGAFAMDLEKFGLSIEQTELLYNIELQKVKYDISETKLLINNDGIINLKRQWLEEWKSYMEKGFSSFVNNEAAKLHWYSTDELIKKINENNPKDVWFKLLLLEAMLFEPYYVLSFEKDKKGNDVPSKAYNSLHLPGNGFNKDKGDLFLEEYFSQRVNAPGLISRLRKSYNREIRDLRKDNERLLKNSLITVGAVAVVAISAGSLAPHIAVLLVGSQFAGLSGAALTSACLAYLGGGAIAAGGFGMAGGTAAIVGGGAILGLGAGGVAAGVSSSANNSLNKTQTIEQTARLMVSFKEIFLNDMHDLYNSNAIYNQYEQSVEYAQSQLASMKRKEVGVSKEEAKQLKNDVKSTEDSIKVMLDAMKTMKKFQSSFETGLQIENKN